MPLIVWPTASFQQSLFAALQRKSAWVIHKLFVGKKNGFHPSPNVYNYFYIWTQDKSIFFLSFVKQLWVLSKNSWLLTRQLASSITLHVDSGCCLSICAACCLPVLNYGELGVESKREGVSGRGCLCSHFHGGDIILFYALTVASYIGFQSLLTFKGSLCEAHPA